MLKPQRDALKFLPAILPACRKDGKKRELMKNPLFSCPFCPASWREKPLKPPDHTPTTILKNDGFSGAVVRRTAGVGAGN